MISGAATDTTVRFRKLLTVQGYQKRHDARADQSGQDQDRRNEMRRS